MIYCLAYPPRKPRRFYEEAAAEYEKRLGRFCRIERVDAISQHAGRDFIITFSPEGRQISSENMAERLLSLESGGEVNRIIFCLKLKEVETIHADETWAFTTVGIPEDLLAVLLLEQIYRAQKILHHEPYHK